MISWTVTCLGDTQSVISRTSVNYECPRTVIGHRGEILGRSWLEINAGLHFFFTILLPKVDPLKNVFNCFLIISLFGAAKVSDAHALTIIEAANESDAHAFHLL